MAHESLFSNLMRSVVFFIGSFTVPVFVFAVTTAIIAAMPNSVSSDVRSHQKALRAEPSVIYRTPQPDLPDRWTWSKEPVTFDHMYANR